MKHFGIAAIVSVLAAVFGGLLMAEETPRLICFGSDPDWKLGLTADQADFSYKRAVRFDIPHQAQAENRDWPRALTLLAQTDTAILLLDQDICTVDGQTYAISADVLTQDGSAAILLTGCCKKALP